ncbi:MAG: photosystem II stability/assembly factor-like uncharacterized protein [Saprospiraceae bacterium]|jgi:photosystem II stability/assembly factor-like uncharacterized protein
MYQFLLALGFLILIQGDIYTQQLDAFQFRNLGPYRGGRVTAVAGITNEPSVFYMGATGGGVWKSEDYGTSWDNVSDGYFSTPSIGAISVAQNDPNIIYIGTGSDGLRSNVISGKGVYKSIDAGETWTHIGLDNVGQIGAVRIHPINHNIVYVAAIGQAFNESVDRGIYKTTNGGKTWQKVLYVSPQTGISDIEMMPSNPDILYAAAWKAERKPWTIISGGTLQEGGIYKSIDAGATWDKIDNGLPDQLIGKIDLAVSPADSKVVYALIEAPLKEGGLYKSINQAQSFSQVSDHKGIRNRPFYYTNIKVDPTNIDVIYSMAGPYHKSTDGGNTWKSKSSPHGDNHDMWINPNNADLFIQSNDGGANVTHNGGKTWSTQFNQPTAEIYQIAVDDQHPYWVYGGQQDNMTTISVPTLAPYGIQAPGIGYIMNTGGCETGPAIPKPGNPNIVYSNCKGRFGVYDKSTGTEQSYYVGASNMYGHNPKDLKYRFQRVSPIHVSPHDPDVIYHCSQYVHKTTDEGKTWTTISPDLTAFEADKQVISGSPITRDITGEEFYSTIYDIQESPIKKGVIWVGSNDGPIHVTQDGGTNWTDVTPRGLPKGGRVDAIEPSPHNPAKAYAAILLYQLGDWKPYLYKTVNYGKSWKLITNGIPTDYPCRVLREDPDQEGHLFAGTEYGLFISLDDGDNWKAFQQNLPVTPITDMKIHRGDLVLSTMGRSFWVLDNISTLSQMESLDIAKSQLYQPKATYRYKYPSGARGSTMPKYPRPAVIIDYSILDSVKEAIKLEITNEDGKVINTLFSDDKIANIADTVIENMSTNQIEYIVDNSLSTHIGLNRYRWDMTESGPWHSDEKKSFKNGPFAAPGSYTLRLTIDGKEMEQTFELLMDPRIAEYVTLDDISKQVILHRNIKYLLADARRQLDKLEKEKAELEKKDEKNADDLNRIEKASSLITQLKTKEGIYELPVLVDQISYLYNMLGDTDQLPGRDAYERYEELKEKLEGLE